MRASCSLWVALLVLGAVPRVQADEGAGLTLPYLQGRVRLGMGIGRGAADLSGGIDPPSRLGMASVLGDYYFGRYGPREGDTSGFRATTGVFLGSRLGLWGGLAPASLSGSQFSVERQSFSLLAPPRPAVGAAHEAGTFPYLGLGYSGSSLKGGWGFSADLGLTALNPGNAARLGRVFGGGQTLDDAVRELRLSPLVQLGASYLF